jgi:threonine/homoserine/homoserine lactone efflux protein
MIYLSTLCLIGGLYLVAAASPGPNFFIICQLALAGARHRACVVAAGITAGSTLWAASAMAGLATLLLHVSWLSLVLKLAGAAYLVWYGLTLLRNAGQKGAEVPAHSQHVPTPGRAFRTGLLTSLTNPKSGVFWTSVFATTLPVDAPVWVYVATALMIAVLSATWHVGIALVLMAGPMQAAYRRLRRPLDTACGTVLVVLVVRLALSRHS